MDSPSPSRVPHLRPRSMAAVVLSRAASPSPAHDTIQPHPTTADESPPRRWPTVLLWIVLGTMIAAAWGLLLFGDSLRTVSG